MRLSIRMRVILAMNAFVLCLAFAFGWIAQEVAGRTVESRLTREMVSSVSEFLVKNDLPRSQLMMRYLNEMFDADWVVTEGDPPRIITSSLSSSRREDFSREAGRVGDSGIVNLGGARFRLDSEDFSIPEGHPDASDQSRFHILLPYEVIQSTRDTAFAQVRRVIWPAAGLATVVAVLLAFSITRPIGKLAEEMDQLAAKVTFAENKSRREAPGAPTEIHRLTSSFHHLMDRLTEARSELARSERLATLGKVCLSVAHELRNPLSGIKMNVRVLKDDLEPDSRGHPGVEAILREVDRMEMYLGELMNLSPDARAAPGELDYSETRLSVLAESVLEILSGRCRHAGIEIERNYPDDEPAVLVDPKQIRQAMMNLMVNAIEVMSSGGTIKVEVQCHPDSVAFAVADTGRGVDCGDADIFEAFVSGKPNGVGLGLYLCKQIVKRHGGNIDYLSSSTGTTFWFELPRLDSSHTKAAGRDEHSDSESNA